MTSALPLVLLALMCGAVIFLFLIAMRDERREKQQETKDEPKRPHKHGEPGATWFCVDESCPASKNDT